jgi:16S rRNA (cytosine1402-N4)-methyltransferase
MLDEVVRLLDPREGDTVVDCTAGLGGHAAALAERLGHGGTMVLNDLDPGLLARAEARVRALPDPPRVLAWRGNYADVPRRLAAEGLPADVVLADLGFASTQVEDAERGFSFMRDGPLDMRLDPSSGVSAADLVNTLSERELGEILRDFGEERAWGRIAQKLVAERKSSPISTTGRLASIVRSVLGPRTDAARIDPATRTFQALRIAVNDEIGCLRSLLESVSRSAAMGGGWLKKGARVGVIAFHSLEDRLVKEIFNDLVKRGLARPVGGRPVAASAEEVGRNPRARSAKLRTVRLAVDTPDLAGGLV